MTRRDTTLFSIRNKFTLLFLLFQLVGLALIGHVTFTTVHNAVEENALLSMSSAVRRIVREATLFHEEVQRDIHTAMEHSIFVKYFSLPESMLALKTPVNEKLAFSPQQLKIKEELDAWLVALQKWYPVTESCVIDHQGKEHSRIVHGKFTATDDYSVDEYEAPFFYPTLMLKPHEVHTAYPYFTHDSHQWVFAYTSPIVMKDGTTPAFLHMEISVTLFQDLVRPRQGSYFDRRVGTNVDLEGGGADRFIIVDEHGAVVADSGSEVVIKKPENHHHKQLRFSDFLPRSQALFPDPAFQKIVTSMNQGEIGHGIFMQDDKPYLASYHPLPTFGWSLVAIRSYDALLEGRSDIEMIRRVILGTGIAILLVSAFTVWFGVGRIIRPLNALTKAAREIAAGNQEIPFPSDFGRDEIGNLALSLRQMRETIIAYQQDLEHKILQRTEKYLGANRRLHETIEELENTREELVHQEKMASLGRLVAGFAHEINTPIGICIGSLSAIPEEIAAIRHMITQEEEEVDGRLLDRRLTHLDENAKLGLSNLVRAADIVSRFKRTSMDQSTETARLFNVREVIEDVVLSLHSAFKKSRIWIETTCAPDITVYSHPGALGQVLTNLLMNSLVHGFNNGELTGTIEIKVELGHDNTQLAITYSDTGKGMSAHVLKKIFDPFFTTARDKGGSGLGMYICYNIVRAQLKGTIECGSHPGEGTVFLIQFPVGVFTQNRDKEES